MNDPRAVAALETLRSIEGRLLIGNTWVAAGDRLDTISPSTGAAIGAIGLASADDVDTAVAAGRAALDGEWGNALPAQRARAMLKLADLIDANVERIAAVEAADGVRNYIEVLYGDAPAGASVFRYFAGLAGAIEGSVKYPSIGYAPPGCHVRAYVDKAPVGVVAAIIPWNFPFIMACVRLAPALAAGCPVVLKPAEDASLSSLLLGQLAVEAGFPAGVIGVLPGRGDVAGAALVAHAGIDKISFTGSTRVGREIGRVAGEAFRKHSLELGGKCAAIVGDDADVDAAVAALAGSAFGNAGQVCVASARLLVHRSRHDAFRAKIEAVAKVRRTGSNFDGEATLGPIINAKQRERITALIDDARASGAEVSGDHANDSEGIFLNPVVIAGASAGCRLASEEIFGPVVQVEPFDDLDEAVARANATPYGLAGSIWTQRWRDADRVARTMAAGTIYVNCHAWADPSLPMAGLKASGIGVEGGREGVDSCLTAKTVLAVL